MQQYEFVISICVPSFRKFDDVVYYQLVFTQNSQRCLFSVNYRYSHLKKLHESLLTLKETLPKFPSTNWWRSTNSNEEYIEERRVQLDYYFKTLLLCQEIYKSLIIKNFIIKSQCLYLRKLEKQQKTMIKKEQEAGVIIPNIYKQKAQSQLITPVCGPAQDPLDDPKERTPSREFKFAKKKSLSMCIKENTQLNNLNFGGVPIFKGIILRLK